LLTPIFYHSKIAGIIFIFGKKKEKKDGKKENVMGFFYLVILGEYLVLDTLALLMSLQQVMMEI